MAQTLKEWYEAHKSNPPLTYSELHHDDTRPDGMPSVDALLLGDDLGYYKTLGNLVEVHPIVSAGIRRG